MLRRSIEELAANLTVKYQVGEPPVPIEQIARSEGALIARNHFSGSESGFALRADDRWIIGVNTLASPRRQRFTIAHELGHLVLRHGKPLIVDHSVYVSHRDEVSSRGTEPEEVDANAFAAAILMPKEMILRALRAEVDFGLFSSRDELIARLAREFDVSVEAMGYRLINLNLIAA